MEKSKLMIEYESRTGLKSVRIVGDHWCSDEAHTETYVDDLEERLTETQAKAEAYDRIMSGGKKTLKEWANIFGMPFAIDGGRYGYNCDDVGSKEPLIWIPPRFIDYDGNYGESRTRPDGWESTNG